jgi:hypothetical protein
MSRRAADINPTTSTAAPPRDSNRRLRRRRASLFASCKIASRRSNPSGDKCSSIIIHHPAQTPVLRYSEEPGRATSHLKIPNLKYLKSQI